MNLLTEELLIFQILVQLITAFIATRVYFRDHRKGFLYLVFALYLMVLRRVTAFLAATGIMESVELIDRIVLPFGISLLMLKGMYEIYKFVSPKRTKRKTKS